MQTIDGRALTGEGGDVAGGDRWVRYPGGAVAIDPRRTGREGASDDRLAGGCRFGEGDGVDAPVGPARLGGGEPTHGRRGIEVDPRIPSARPVAGTHAVGAREEGPGPAKATGYAGHGPMEGQDRVRLPGGCRQNRERDLDMVCVGCGACAVAPCREVDDRAPPRILYGERQVVAGAPPDVDGGIGRHDRVREDGEAGLLQDAGAGKGA